MTATDMWYFPVMLQEKIIAILVVDKMEGVWEAVSLGYIPLANELQLILPQWSGERGFTPQFMVCFQAQSYFFTIPQRDSYNLTRIQFALPGRENQIFRNYVTPQTLSDTVASLKQQFAENQ